jgi:CspA family cold shock protein
METGTVKWFDKQKGYGFITPDAAGKDLFVHHEELFGEANSSLAVGARVEYQPQTGAKGPRAFNVAVAPIQRNRRYGAVDG